MKKFVNVLQWNILASNKADQSDMGFPWVPQEYLSWEYRFPKIINVITSGYSFMCLQEVDRPDEIKKKLSYHYNCEFLPKKDQDEGVMICYDKYSWELIEKVHIHFPESSQVALFCRFSDKNNNKQIIIGTTHLKAKESGKELRNIQSKHLTNYINNIKDNIPLIFCGDMNDTPDSEAIENIISSSSMNSAFPLDKKIFTTCKRRHKDYLTKRMIDYIFFKNTNTLLHKDMNQFDEEHGYPTSFHPSDHLYLVANFII